MKRSSHAARDDVPRWFAFPHLCSAHGYFRNSANRAAKTAATVKSMGTLATLRLRAVEDRPEGLNARMSRCSTSTTITSATNTTPKVVLRLSSVPEWNTDSVDRLTSDVMVLQSRVSG